MAGRIKQQEVRTPTVALVNVVNGRVLILKNAAGSTRVKEITAQPEGDCTLQIWEGGGLTSNSGRPWSAPRFVGAALLWSVPGDVALDDLFLQIDTPGAIVNVDVRSVPEPEC